VRYAYSLLGAAKEQMRSTNFLSVQLVKQYFHAFLVEAYTSKTTNGKESYERGRAAPLRF